MSTQTTGYAENRAAAERYLGLAEFVGQVGGDDLLSQSIIGHYRTLAASHTGQSLAYMIEEQAERGRAGDAVTTTYADSVTRNGRTRAILADLVARAADADAPPERLAKRIAVYRAERYGAHMGDIAVDTTWME